VFAYPGIWASANPISSLSSSLLLAFCNSSSELVERFTHVLIEAGQGLKRSRWSGEDRPAAGVADLASISRVQFPEDGSNLHQELGKGLSGLRPCRGGEEKKGARNWARRLE